MPAVHHLSGQEMHAHAQRTAFPWFRHRSLSVAVATGLQLSATAMGGSLHVMYRRSSYSEHKDGTCGVPHSAPTLQAKTTSAATEQPHAHAHDPKVLAKDLNAVPASDRKFGFNRKPLDRAEL